MTLRPPFVRQNCRPLSECSSHKRSSDSHHGFYLAPPTVSMIVASHCVFCVTPSYFQHASVSPICLGLHNDSSAACHRCTKSHIFKARRGHLPSCQWHKHQHQYQHGVPLRQRTRLRHPPEHRCPARRTRLHHLASDPAICCQLLLKLHCVASAVPGCKITAAFLRRPGHRDSAEQSDDRSGGEQGDCRFINGGYGADDGAAGFWWLDGRSGGGCADVDGSAEHVLRGDRAEYDERSCSMLFESGSLHHISFTNPSVVDCTRVLGSWSSCCHCYTAYW